MATGPCRDRHYLVDADALRQIRPGTSAARSHCTKSGVARSNCVAIREGSVANTVVSISGLPNVRRRSPCRSLRVLLLCSYACGRVYFANPYALHRSGRIRIARSSDASISVSCKYALVISASKYR